MPAVANAFLVLVTKPFLCPVVAEGVKMQIKRLWLALLHFHKITGLSAAFSSMSTSRQIRLNTFHQFVSGCRYWTK